MSVRRCKSVSDQQFRKTKLAMGKGLTFNCNEDHYLLLKARMNNNKSELIINRTLLITEDQTTDNNISDSQLLPTPKTPKQPKEIMRKSLMKLKSTQCNECLTALRDIVQISRFNPKLLEKSLPIIYKGTTSILKSLRLSAARTACQAANELLMNVTFAQGPEFDELIYTLLQKTADSNKYLKKDAAEALDSMVIHVPPYYSVKILFHKKIAGYALPVRTTAAKLLACVVNILITDSSITLTEETNTRLVLAAIRFLQDDYNEIKFHGIRLMTMLLQRKDYENILRKKISGAILKKFNKIMEVVKGDLQPYKREI